MVPETSILRKLPTALNAEERWRLEAIVYASDAIEIAFHRIVEIASFHGKLEEEMAHIDKSALFLYAWSILDQIYFLQRPLSWANNSWRLETFTLLSEVSAPASELRNKMDHFDQNVRNLSRTQGRQYPAFGALSYFVVGNEDIEGVGAGGKISGGTLVSIVAGNVHGEFEVPVVNPAGDLVSVPISHVQLSAYRTTFEISKAVGQLRRTMAELSALAEVSIHAAASAAASAQGLNVDAVKSGPVGGFVATMRLSLGTGA